MRRLPLLLVALAFVLIWASETSAAGEAPARTQALPLVQTPLPAWLAPGGRLTVSGFARGNVVVELRIGSSRIATTRSGRLGKFVLAARAPRVGSHRLTVASGGVVKPVGTLLVRSLTLAAVGDITPGEAVGPTIQARGTAYPWGSVGPLLRSADITIGNLEGAISSRGYPVPNKQYHFRGPLALLTGAARYAGMDVMSLANNHIMDYGATALRDTLMNARRAKILTVGAGANEGAARRPVFIERGGLRVGFLGYSDVNPVGFPAGPSSYGLSRATTEAIQNDVRAVRKRADLVVVYFHWGQELHTQPDSNMRLFASASLRAGAQVVLGAHPHVLGPVSRQGRSLVAWTLGNFVFPPGSAASLRSGILVTKLSARGVESHRLVPATSGVRPYLQG